jgi:hypothetical protein
VVSLQERTISVQDQCVDKTRTRRAEQDPAKKCLAAPEVSPRAVPSLRLGFAFALRSRHAGSKEDGGPEGPVNVSDASGQWNEQDG